MSVRYAGARHAGLSEAKVAALDDLESRVFAPRERIALRFVELMAVDHHKVDDAVFAELLRHFSEAEVVELGASAALNLGLGRLTAILGVEPAWRYAPRRSGSALPWRVLGPTAPPPSLRGRRADRRRVLRRSWR